MTGITLSAELGAGPEDVLVCADGSVLTGLETGQILRVSPDLRSATVLAGTGGRPLGLERMPDGRVLVCDARRGLLALDPASGRLSDHARNPPPFCNNAAVATDGTVYFSSSSQRHPIERSNRDVVEARPTGSLWRCTPDGACTRLMDGLHFANGVALAPDKSHLLVAETGAARVRRYWLSGPCAGRAEPFLTGLDALPDNLSSAPGGGVWIALVAPAAAARAAWRLPYPLRWLAVRLHRPAPPADRLQAMCVGPDGQILHHLDLAGAGYRFVTGVREAGGALYLASIAERRIARLDLSAGLTAPSAAPPDRA